MRIYAVLPHAHLEVRPLRFSGAGPLIELNAASGHPVEIQPYRAVAIAFAACLLLLWPDGA